MIENFLAGTATLFGDPFTIGIFVFGVFGGFPVGSKGGDNATAATTKKKATQNTTMTTKSQINNKNTLFSSDPGRNRKKNN